MIKSGGENVYAAEVESVLCQHPGIKTAAVVGLPDARFGERVAALLVLRPGWSWQGAAVQPNQSASDSTSSVSGGAESAAAARHEAECLVSYASLKQHCQGCGLSGYKVPRVVSAQSSDLPLTSSGKVMKQAVKEQLQRALVFHDHVVIQRSRL